MTGLEDLNQKVIIVVTFTGVLLLIWWYVKAQLAKTTDLVGRGHFRHIESKRLAHASVLSLFEVNNKKVLVLQAKQGASFIDITDTSGTGRNDHV
ncbi:MAG: hypothetical protein ACO2Z2_04755 [Paracoccaceae bacterium]|jgi:hypothetical protein|nr:hypothetical protein [Pseudomonadota bacterium]MDA1293828.1 hypothetical protein [Pseudomonadota bacterium]NDD08881.1 hypothetical protein [Paracoccaceae bacterium]